MTHPKRPTTVSAAGIDLVASFEGFRSHVYRDAVGVPTIGFGETDPAIIRRYGSRPMARGTALRLLRHRLDRDFVPPILALNLPLKQSMLDALASFTYNVGSGAIGPHTGVGRELRAHHWQKAADHLLDWNKAGGRELEGLTRRRHAERRLFLSDVPHKR